MIGKTLKAILYIGKNNFALYIGNISLDSIYKSNNSQKKLKSDYNVKDETKYLN